MTLSFYTIIWTLSYNANKTYLQTKTKIKNTQTNQYISLGVFIINLAFIVIFHYRSYGNDNFQNTVQVGFINDDVQVTVIKAIALLGDLA